jgi:hypothetical protein
LRDKITKAIERKNERCQKTTNPLRHKHLHTKTKKHEKQEKKQVWEVFGHQQDPTSKQWWRDEMGILKKK